MTCGGPEREGEQDTMSHDLPPEGGSHGRPMRCVHSVSAGRFFWKMNAMAMLMM
jgi:hypothetical protein